VKTQSLTGFTGNLWRANPKPDRDMSRARRNVREAVFEPVCGKHCAFTDLDQPVGQPRRTIEALLCRWN